MDKELIRKIENCSQCPFRAVRESLAVGKVFLCDSSSTYRDIPLHEDFFIPYWCPLEDWGTKPQRIWRNAEGNIYRIALIWGEKDVQDIATKNYGVVLNDKNLGKVLDALERHHDTSGINWDVIDATISEVLGLVKIKK